MFCDPPLPYTAACFVCLPAGTPSTFSSPPPPFQVKELGRDLIREVVPLQVQKGIQAQVPDLINTVSQAG